MIDQQQTMDRPAVEQESSSCPAETAMQQSTAKLCQYVEQKPAQSILIGLGVGIGAGLLLGSVLRSSRHYFSQDELLSEKIGSQVKNSLREIVPASLKKHFRS